MLVLLLRPCTMLLVGPGGACPCPSTSASVLKLHARIFREISHHQDFNDLQQCTLCEAYSCRDASGGCIEGCIARGKEAQYSCSASDTVHDSLPLTFPDIQTAKQIFDLATDKSKICFSSKNAV